MKHPAARILSGPPNARLTPPMPLPNWLPLAATALDLTFGDPPVIPHPVRLIGGALNRLERRAPAGDTARRLYGLACLALLAAASGAAAWILPHTPLLGAFFAVYLAYAGLALGCLVREGERAVRLIGKGNLPEARRAVGLLVSRDTGHLDAAGLRRALAETLSENLCDGFAAPLFYLCLGGPGLLWAYKAVSTADSMWGYKTDRFRALGWAAARCDDALAFVPARLCAAFMVLAGLTLKLDARAALANMRRDAAKTASPNAGWPMATAAWLCGAGMGGVDSYFGKPTNKPTLGPHGEPWTETRLARLRLLVPITGVLLAVTAQVVIWLL
jgi:adenosylcobinamide-phosphate synthase